MFTTVQIESFGTLTVHFEDLQTHPTIDEYLKSGLCEYDIEGIEIVLSNGKRIKLKHNEIKYHIERFDLVEAD